MKRSAGITITAVIDFVGCAFTLFSALASVLVLVVQSIIPPSSPGAAAMEFPPMLRAFQFIAVLFFFLAVVWGVSTGVGLLRLRDWARISQLIFAGLITLIGVCSALLLLLIQLPMPATDPNPEATQTVLHFTRIFIALMYGGLAALGIWWLYYFTRRPIRDEFSFAARHAVTIPTAIPAELPGGVPFHGVEPFAGPMHQGRPVSITIIAALLLLGVANLIVVPLYHVPLLFFGELVSGAPGMAVLSILALTQALAGYGLLKMKMWGRNLAIAVELFATANLLGSSLRPGSQAHFDEFMQRMYAQWKLPSNFPAIHFPVALMLLPAIPVVLVILYFLFKEKPAFERAALKSASPA
jgi:hypothetical protein